MEGSIRPKPVEWFIDGLQVPALPADMVHLVRWKAFGPGGSAADGVNDLPEAAAAVLRRLDGGDFACGIDHTPYEVFAFRKALDALVFRVALDAGPGRYERRLAS